MIGNIENLKLNGVYQGTASTATKQRTRTTHIFTFRQSGTANYHFAEKTLTVNEGEVIFIPIGETYHITYDTKEKTRYFSIVFTADIKNPKPEVFSFFDFYEKEYMLNHYKNLWDIGTESEHYKCYSIFYSFLAYIANIENQSYSAKKKLEIIKPATDYLNKHIFDTSLKADKLHLLCGISDTYFRKIFESRFGTSPQKYIIGKRLSQAEAIIDSGNFDTISDVARSVGYTDPLYFSRAFTRRFGISPSRLNKTIEKL